MSTVPQVFRATTVAELMTPNPEALLADATVGEAITLMEKRRFRHLPVVDDERMVIGILTQRDILRLAWPTDDSDVAERLTNSALIRDVMQAEVVTIREEESIGTAARYILRSKRDCLPVVGPNGHLIGILTAVDFLREIVRNTPSLPDEGEQER